MHHRLRCLTFVVVALLFCSACDQGPPLGAVSGTVSYEGKPVEKATITFTHVTEGRTAFARTDADGHYQLKFSDGRRGALLGENAVAIETARVGADENGEIVQFPETLPKRYNAESEITREIESGDQTLDFALTKE